ncbi:DMT family transporter [Paenibacillus sp. D2_2]|uniref:DMT family transporter n=1 Tax=Paenibacillus sp. D2_2 TaxID=3073092 RepID=UPI0028154626|nr:DMT family transporter [Paenibacillus sp. D2_2]WMT38797.1 DMT family transporter [Paenibacillus sp. D2_2]
MNKRQNKLAYIAAILNALIIGFSFLFVKLALQVSHPLDTLAHRFTIAFIATALLLIITRRRIQLDFRTLLTLIPLALFYPFLFFVLQTFGLVYTTLSEAGIVNALVPIFTMLLASIFLKERSSLLQKLFTVLTVAGVVFIFVMKGVQMNSSSSLGIVLILLSALSFSSYSVLARKITQKVHLLDISFVMSLIGALSFNGISVIHHGLQGSMNHYFDAFTAPSFILSILYLGVLSSLMTSLLANFALKHMEASKMSIFGNVGTIFTILGGAIFLKEPIAYYHIIGAIMVLIGVVGVSLTKPGGSFSKAKKSRENSITAK